MANIVYRVTVEAFCSTKLMCPAAKMDIKDATMNEVVKGQDQFLRANAFCTTCGSPTRFTVQISPNNARSSVSSQTSKKA